MILHPIIDLLKRIVVALPDYAGGGGGSELELLIDHTATENVSTINIDIPENKQTMDIYVVVLTGTLSVSDWIYPHFNTKNPSSNSDVYLPKAMTYSGQQLRVIKKEQNVAVWLFPFSYHTPFELSGYSMNTSIKNVLLNLYTSSVTFTHGFNVKIYGGMLNVDNG